MMKLAPTIIVNIEGHDSYCFNIDEFGFIFPHIMMMMTRSCDDNGFDLIQMSHAVLPDVTMMMIVCTILNACGLWIIHFRCAI